MKLSVAKVLEPAHRRPECGDVSAAAHRSKRSPPGESPPVTVAAVPFGVQAQNREEAARARRALEIVFRTLARLPRDFKILRLMGDAERLLAETARWQHSSPSAERREHVARTTLSIHLETLRTIAEAERKSAEVASQRTPSSSI